MRRRFAFTPPHRMKLQNWSGNTSTPRLRFSLMLHTDTRIILGKIAINTPGLKASVGTVELVRSQDLHEILLHDRCRRIQAAVEKCTPKEVVSPVDLPVILV
jgi:hypothetical protein